ncbi:MAG TPA: hypothetical protein VEU97_16465, partial [Ktedonobacteraceae bacterium]|nr:hypothetical protein [Ktedonobacteraceae bacterium]
TTPAAPTSGGMPVQHYPNTPVSPVSHAGPYVIGTLQTPPQQTFPTAIQSPAPTTYPPVRRFSPLSASLLVILLVLLVIGSSGLFYFTTVAHPGELHSQATAVAQTVLTTQAESTAQVLAQASATTAALTPDQLYTRATSGTPLIDDPLNDPTTTIWIHRTSADYGCSFIDSVYHIKASMQAGGAFCSAYKSLFKNFAFQAQMTLTTPGIGGLIFNFRGGSAYFFAIDHIGGYVLDIAQNGNTKNLLSGTSTLINVGLNQTNLLTAVTFDDQIYIYVNKRPLGHVSNSVSTQGQIGLFAQTFLSDGAVDIVFSNAQVWSL